MKKSSKTEKAVKPAKTVKKCAAKSTAKKPVAKAKAVVFTVRAEAGAKVFLAGSFNDWNPEATAMTEKKGVYSASLKLAPGRYEYKFVINGEWMADCENQDFVQNECGTLNSVVTVK